jgi:hypothetical protein
MHQDPKNPAATNKELEALIAAKALEIEKDPLNQLKIRELASLKSASSLRSVGQLQHENALTNARDEDAFAILQVSFA